MGTVHLGRLIGAAGFARTVAIKRLHEHLACDASIAEAFAAEARLAARVRHPNVVPTIDVVTSETTGVLLVMEYVDGEALSGLLRASSERVPLPIAIAIVAEMLHGLHAAHEATSEHGEPLEIVHRDVSPQNVLVGADGVTRLVDFGIARATNEAGHTGEGELRGKLAYMAPEQIRHERITRRIDVYAAGIVLWELLTGQRLFAAEHPGATIEKILVGWIPPPSSVVRDLPPELDAIALRALDPEPAGRFATAREMAMALEDAVRPALGREVAAWVESRAGQALARRRALFAAVERAATFAAPAAALPPIEETATHVLSHDDPSVDGVVVAPEPAAPRRSRVGATALALVLAAAAALLVVTSRGRLAPAAPPELPAEPLTFVAAPPSDVSEPLPLPTAVLIAPPALPARPLAAAALAVHAPAPEPAEPAAARPAPRRAAIVRPRRAPCVAKVDPVTQKRVYQGDCD